MEKFYKTPVEEQETTILIDYFARRIDCYTSRKAVYERLTKVLGCPSGISYIKGEISGCIWRISFDDKKRANAIFSKSNVIGQFK